MKISDLVNEVKQRLDAKCWKGKHIGTPKTKIKGGIRVNNCVPNNESVSEGDVVPVPTKPIGMSDEAAAKKIAAKLLGTPDITVPTLKSYIVRYLPMVGKKPKDIEHLTALVYHLLYSDDSLDESKKELLARFNKLKEDWQKVNKKDRTDGMSRKAVKAYRREHPGSKLKTAVTTKPSKLKRGSKASKRRKSYCSRSAGQQKMHHINCRKTPDKAICKARRRWNCESTDKE